MLTILNTCCPLCIWKWFGNATWPFQKLQVWPAHSSSAAPSCLSWGWEKHLSFSVTNTSSQYPQFFINSSQRPHAGTSANTFSIVKCILSSISNPVRECQSPWSSDLSVPPCSWLPLSLRSYVNIHGGLEQSSLVKTDTEKVLCTSAFSTLLMIKLSPASSSWLVFSLNFLLLLAQL